MIDKFNVSGYFYENLGYKCRKYLDIKCKLSNASSPDLMVVMMNPGASYPIDGIENNHIPSEAVPDKTQNQIMKIMCNASFNYARILNLSDLRTPKSANLYAFLKSDKSNDFPHSIFDPKRRNELDCLFINNVPVIFGWGVNSALSKLSQMAINAINHQAPVGINKKGSDVAYYHPLPPVYNDQVEWVKQVSNMLNCGSVP